MNDNKFLNQIGDLIDKKLDKKLDPIKADLNGVKADLKGIKLDLNGVKSELRGVKKQLETVELKVEVVNKRVGQLGGELKQTEQRLEKSITKSQEDTIEILSALIHTGYNMHEERIEKIEDKLQITSPQQ